MVADIRTEEVTDALQNVILQHSDIRTFVRHYEVDVDVDVQGIVRRTGSQSALVRFACSLSASIDPDRPFKLSPEESLSLNELPVIREKQNQVELRKRKWQKLQAKLEQVTNVFERQDFTGQHENYSERQKSWQEKLKSLEEKVVEANQKRNRAVRDLRSEKQRQRNKRIRENLRQYQEEQPVIDLERQLQGLMVDTKVMGALQHTPYVTPEFTTVIDTMLTMPGVTVEAERQRRIKAINAVTAFCGVEEGRPTPRPMISRRRPACDDFASPAKRQRCRSEDELEGEILQAIEAVRVKSRHDRPRVCFICVGNPNLPMKNRILEHTTPGSLTRHFLRRHVNPSWPAEGVSCNVCGNHGLQQKSDLVNHAEQVHGTVVRGPNQQMLSSQLSRTSINPHCDY